MSGGPTFIDWTANGTFISLPAQRMTLVTDIPSPMSWRTLLPILLKEPGSLRGNPQMPIVTDRLRIARAREALKGSFYSDNPVVVYSPHANQAITPVTLPHHVADQIAEYLQRGQKELATHELDHLLERYRSNQEPIENVKVACLPVSSYCFRLRIASQPFVSEPTESQTTVYKQIQESKNIQQLTDILKRLIQSCSEALASNDKQTNYIVIECQKYIREHYNQNLNLQIIADHIHINSSYLSRLYKRVTGESSLIPSTSTGLNRPRNYYGIRQIKYLKLR